MPNFIYILQRRIKPLLFSFLLNKPILLSALSLQRVWRVSIKGVTGTGSSYVTAYKDLLHKLQVFGIIETGHEFSYEDEFFVDVSVKRK